MVLQRFFAIEEMLSTAAGRIASVKAGLRAIESRRRSAAVVIPSMAQVETSGFIDSAIRLMLLDMDSETALA